jgi:hypothetical protein
MVDGMGEHIYRVLLSDLNKLRIICARCKTVLETDLGHLEIIEFGKCPGCQADYASGRNRPLKDLQTLLQKFQTMEEHYQIEFPIKISG